MYRIIWCPGSWTEDSSQSTPKIGTSRNRLSIGNPEIHRANIRSRWSSNWIIWLLQRVPGNRLVLWWVILRWRGSFVDFQNALLTGNWRGRRWARLGLRRGWREHVERFLGRVGSGISIRGRIFRILSQVDCRFRISSRFNGSPGGRGIRWVILAAGAIYWAQSLSHRVLVAWWCYIVIDLVGTRGLGRTSRSLGHRRRFLSRTNWASRHILRHASRFSHGFQKGLWWSNSRVNFNWHS